MNEDTEKIQEYLLSKQAPAEILVALMANNHRLEAYAIDKDDAAKALGWKGIPMTEQTSIADGIEVLYARMLNRSANAAKLVGAMKRWREEEPLPQQREQGLSDELLGLYSEYNHLMSLWAEKEFTSRESDDLDDRMDIVRVKVMERLPYIIKVLRHQDSP